MPQKVDQFGRKRYQKKRKNVDYKLPKDFFKNILLYMKGRLSRIRLVVYFGWICLFILGRKNSMYYTWFFFLQCSVSLLKRKWHDFLRIFNDSLQLWLLTNSDSNDFKRSIIFCNNISLTRTAGHWKIFEYRFNQN